MDELRTVAEGDNTNPLAGTLYTNSGFGPIVDGNIVQDQPSSVGVQVPSIFGSSELLPTRRIQSILDTNKNHLAATKEDSLFLLPQVALKSAPTASDYSSFVTTSFQNLSSQVLDNYPVNVFNDDASPSYAAMLTVATEYTYFCPAYRALQRANEKNIPVWTYYWNHTNSCPWTSSISKDTLAVLGPTHTSEIPYVFANTNDLPQPSGSCDFTAAEKKISSFLVSAWTSLAESGDLSGSSINWPAFDGDTSTQGILITDNGDTSAAISTTIDYSVCGFWDQIDNSILQYISNTSSNSTSESPAATLNYARLDTTLLLLTTLLTCLFSSVLL